ncbi:hypothetical protein BraRD5C2_09930 [Bradyrhizobium sp. RD5-C2]|nr:hypothetical protein BraRD5C2_09930 [Bradyrhizobium sp. RD5-C2]
MPRTDWFHRALRHTGRGLKLAAGADGAWEKNNNENKEYDPTAGAGNWLRGTCRGDVW